MAVNYSSSDSEEDDDDHESFLRKTIVESQQNETTGVSPPSTSSPSLNPDFTVKRTKKDYRLSTTTSVADQWKKEGQCYCSRIMSLTVRDSFLFLSASLERLVNMLRDSSRPLNCTECQQRGKRNKEDQSPCSSCFGKKDIKETFSLLSDYVKKNHGPDKLYLYLRKGNCPYSFVNKSTIKMKGLPEKSCWFNKLTNSVISDDDLQFAQTFFKELKLRTLSDFVLEYNICDAYLLAIF